MSDLQGWRAVVTGAGKGLGRTFVHALAKAGCDVVAFSRSIEDLETLRQEISEYPRRFVFVTGDVSNETDVARLERETQDALGGADILLNNAGVSFPDPALEQTLEHWNKTIAVNLTGPFLCSKAFAPGMIERGFGRIINISSAAGLAALGNHAAYATSKGGLHALTRELAIEWGSYGITVNAIAPTVVLTPMGQKVWGDPAKREPMLAKIPIARFGIPDEVAGAVLYLASGGAALINGHVLVLDGGYTAQ